MRLGLSLNISGDDKAAAVPSLLTVEKYVAWVNDLPVSDMVKDKFRRLLTKMPSTALRSVLENSNTYVRRFEEEVNREMNGLLNPMKVNEKVTLKNEEKNGNENAQEEETCWQEIDRREVYGSHPIQVTLPTECTDQGRCSNDLEQPAP